MKLAALALGLLISLAPELVFVHGVGRRVDESGLGLIAGYAFSAGPCLTGAPARATLPHEAT